MIVQRFRNKIGGQTCLCAMGRQKRPGIFTVACPPEILFVCI